MKNYRLRIIKLELLIAIASVLTAISTFTSSYKDIKDEITTFEEDNEDLIKLYQKYIEVIATYYSIKYDDVFEIYEAFYTMYSCGLLSYDNYFFTVDEPELDIIKYGGIDVVNGKGVCRNVNCCFTDILKEIGYNCGNIYGTLNNEDEFNIKVNHVVTWVEINNQIYLLDPYNHTIFTKKNLIYQNEKKVTFIPSCVKTKSMNEDVNFDILFSTNSKLENKNVFNYEDLIDYIEFENNDLEELEKQIVLKMDTLQTK